MSLEHRVLEILKRNVGEYVSGNDIAALLNVSRMAINKAISSLRRKGFLIEAYPRLGYKLLDLDDISILDSYLKDLSTILKYRVIYMERATSTQEIARALAEKDANEGMIVIAEEQTLGRGRFGRKWISPKGGLWFTILLRPEVHPSKLTLISLLSGIAVALGIMDITGLKPRLKWPNDVLIKDRKLAGILVEASTEAEVVKYCLVGIGINVNNEIPNQLIGKAVSLKEILGEEVPRVTLMRGILRRFDEEYMLLRKGKIEDILDIWKSLSDTLGRKVKILGHHGEIVGIATDIDRDGALILKVNDRDVRIRAGDVIHLRRA